MGAWALPPQTPAILSPPWESMQRMAEGCCEFPPRNPTTLRSWGFAPPLRHPGSRQTIVGTGIPDGPHEGAPVGRSPPAARGRVALAKPMPGECGCFFFPYPLPGLSNDPSTTFGGPPSALWVFPRAFSAKGRLNKAPVGRV